MIRTTRGFSESYRLNNPAKERQSVWELGRFEENKMGVIFFSDCRISSLGEGEQNVGVKRPRLQEERLIVVHIGSPRLIKDVVTNHISICSKTLCDDRPESIKFICKSVFVLVKGIESTGDFWCCVHFQKVLFLAVLDKWILIDVVVKVKLGETDTFSRRQMESLGEGGLGAAMVQVSWGVKVWDSFPAKSPRKEILVIIDNHGNAV